VSILFISCETTRPKGSTEAEVLFREAKELVKDERYILATERLNTLRSQYPYSYYSTHAELLQADILFSQENYVEASSAYILFKDFHPKHKKIDYVTFRIAESFYKQLPDTFDRDLESAKEAIKYYEDLLNFYGKSEYVKNAASRIKECQGLLRKKERYIADFYFKTKVFDSARFRYLKILNEFKHTSLRNHAMIRVLESSYELKDKVSCGNYFKKFKDYVDDEYKNKLNGVHRDCQKIKKQ